MAVVELLYSEAIHAAVDLGAICNPPPVTGTLVSLLGAMATLLGARARVETTFLLANMGLGGGPIHLVEKCKSGSVAIYEPGHPATLNMSSLPMGTTGGSGSSLQIYGLRSIEIYCCPAKTST